MYNEDAADAPLEITIKILPVGFDVLRELCKPMSRSTSALSSMAKWPGVGWT